VVAFYRSRAARPRFTITEVSQPNGLDAGLAARGWTRAGDHLTMAKDVAAPSEDAGFATRGLSVVRHEQATPDWFAVYLDGLNGDRRAVAPRLVEAVPEPRCFFSTVREGRVIASGLSVLDGGVASVQCMATSPEARRTGAARAVLQAIEAYAREGGARRLYLQADAANIAANTLYESVGFTVVGRYHTREFVA
jgi:N-acetylglutamate synthase